MLKISTSKTKGAGGINWGSVLRSIQLNTLIHIDGTFNQSLELPRFPATDTALTKIARFVSVSLTAAGHFWLPHRCSGSTNKEGQSHNNYQEQA
jgi:hypothetical protein